MRGRTCARLSSQPLTKLSEVAVIVIIIKTRRPSAFQGTKLPGPDQAQRSAAEEFGRVSGMTKRAEPT
jgi:hypothetical protein